MNVRLSGPFATEGATNATAVASCRYCGERPAREMYRGLCWHCELGVLVGDLPRQSAGVNPSDEIGTASLPAYVHEPVQRAELYGLTVAWTKHALARWRERCVGRNAADVPLEKIALRAQWLSHGEIFKTRAKGLVFVCLRVQSGAIVLTVTPKRKKGQRPNQQRNTEAHDSAQ